MSISRRSSVNPSITPFPILIFQKQLEIHFLFGESMKNDYDNLYIHPCTFGMSYTSFYYPTSFSRRQPVNSSTLTFNKINLKEVMTNLLAT